MNKKLIIILVMGICLFRLPEPLEARRVHDAAAPLKGLNLFFNLPDKVKAGMHFLTDDRDVANPSGSSLPYAVSDYLKKMMEIIDNPLTDMNLIMQRQQVISDLISQLDLEAVRNAEIASSYFLDDLLCKLIRDSYTIDEGLPMLIKNSNPTDEEIAREIAKVTAKIKEHRESEEYYKELKLSYDEQIYYKLGILEGYIAQLGVLIDMLLSVDNEDVRMMASELKEKSGPLISLTQKGLVDLCRNRDQDKLRFHEFVDDIYETRGAVKELLGKIGGILTFARYVSRNDVFSKAESTPDKPYGYKQGYNFGDNLIHQTPHDSTDDTGCVVLTGALESGRRYNLVSDMYNQLLFQSFGWVLAKDANMRMYDNIFFVDTAETDAKNDLSSFGSEIKNRWTVFVENATGESAAYVYNGFSTTSPLEQYALLSGAVETLRKRGVRFKIVTSNEDFIARYIEHPDFSFYYLRANSSGDNSPSSEQNYTLEVLLPENKNTVGSETLDVAIRQGLPAEVIEVVRGYLDGEIVHLSDGSVRYPQTVTVEGYSEEERRSLKKSAQSFINFFPHQDELYINNNQWGESYLSRRYSTSDREDTTYHSGLHDAPQLMLFSKDDEFSKYGGMRKAELGITETTADYIQEMLMWGTTSNSKELLERQRMFQELISGGEIDELMSLLDRVMAVGGNFARVETFTKHADDFNVYLLEEIGTSIESGTVYIGRGEATEIVKLKVFLDLLSMNMALLGKDEQQLGITEDLAKIKRLIEIHERHTALMKEWENDRSSESTERVHVERESLMEEFARLIGGKVAPDPDFPSFTDLFNSEGKKIYWGEGSLKEMNKITLQLYRKVSPLITPISLYDVDRGQLSSLTHELAEKFSDIHSREHIYFESWGLIAMVDKLLNETDPKTELIDKLLSYDSVHLNQFAHYLNQIFGFYFKDIATPQALWNRFKNRRIKLQKLDEREKLKYQDIEDETYRRIVCEDLTAELDKEIAKVQGYISEQEAEIARLNEIADKEDWQLTHAQGRLAEYQKEIKGLQDLRAKYEANDLATVKAYFKASYEEERKKLIANVPEFYPGIWGLIGGELRKMYSILSLAKMMQDSGFCKVEFTDEPEVSVENAWNPAKPKDGQVKNDINLNTGRMIQFVSGSTMSGKTFYIKDVIWSVLCGMATGFAPADSMRSPIFNNIIYLDRVEADRYKKLNEYENEIEYWKKIIETLLKGNAFLVSCFDELGSSLPARYQSAFNFVLNELALWAGSFVVEATHNHDLIDITTQMYPGHVAVGHLRNRIENGKVIFEYVFEDGHQESNAIEVARTMGFDQEILDLAQSIRDNEQSDSSEGDK